MCGEFDWIWIFVIIETQSMMLGKGRSLLVASLSEGGAEPLQTFVKTITGGGASGLDVLEVY
jgi:hypothetical protein